MKEENEIDENEENEEDSYPAISRVLNILKIKYNKEINNKNNYNFNLQAKIEEKEEKEEIKEQIKEEKEKEKEEYKNQFYQITQKIKSLKYSNNFNYFSLSSLLSYSLTLSYLNNNNNNNNINNNEGSCNFRPIDGDMSRMFMVAILSAILSAPLALSVQYIIANILSINVNQNNLERMKMESLMSKRKSVRNNEDLNEKCGNCTLEDFKNLLSDIGEYVKNLSKDQELFLGKLFSFI